MEPKEPLVALNFQNLFHSDKSTRTFKISTFFNHGKYKIGAHIIKQLKAGCPGCEIQGKVSFIVKYIFTFSFYMKI